MRSILTKKPRYDEQRGCAEESRTKASVTEMTSGRETPPETVKRILYLRSQWKLSIRLIAKRIGCSPETVRKILNRHLQNGTGGA